MNPGSQCSVCPGGHPFKYKLKSTCLNLSERAIELALVATVIMYYKYYVARPNINKCALQVQFYFICILLTLVICLHSFCNRCNINDIVVMMKMMIIPQL